MGYYAFNIQTPEESREAVMNKLFEMGSKGLFESEGRITAYFDSKDDVKKLSDDLGTFRDILEASGLAPDFSFEYGFIPEKDWNEEWKKSIVPINAGESFIIIPPWEKKTSKRIPLIIDPGMAFGTGHHETTKACVELTERISRKCGKEGFLDVGTGTGILAIAGSKSGFKEVVGVDTDPLAIEAAKRNVGLNNLRNVEIKPGGISEVEGKFNLIVANLVSETLISIAHEIKNRLCHDGIVILSGMLAGQENDVITAMSAQGLRLIETKNDGKWVSLVFGQTLQ